MVAKVASRNNLQHRFIANGIVDKSFKNFKRCPDFNKIIAKCKNNPIVKEYNRCLEQFPYIFDRYLAHGRVQDTDFESLSFPQDVTIQNNCVRRDSKIT